MGGQIAGPCVFELAPLVSLAMHAARWMNILRTNAETAAAASTATATTAQQDRQRVLCEAFAATPFGPPSFWVFLQLIHQQR